jgi:hypothetical protein
MSVYAEKYANSDFNKFDSFNFDSRMMRFLVLENLECALSHGMRLAAIGFVTARSGPNRTYGPTQIWTSKQQIELAHYFLSSSRSEASRRSFNMDCT